MTTTIAVQLTQEEVRVLTDAVKHHQDIGIYYGDNEEEDENICRSIILKLEEVAPPPA